MIVIGLIMPLDLFLFLCIYMVTNKKKIQTYKLSIFLFVSCGELSWLYVSFFLHVKNIQYRIVIVSYRTLQFQRWAWQHVE